MFFSVIIPVYNSEKSLDRCLQSVLDQTFEDYEVVIIDDGSSDSSPQISRRYAEADPRFRYIRQENGGVSSARNRGMQEAKGEFLVFLDSDDCYRPAYLETFFHLISDNPECDHFWCGYCTLSNDPEVNGAVTKLPGSDTIVFTDRRQIMSLHEAILVASPCNKAFRTDIVKRNNIQMPLSLSLGEDLLFNLDYLEHGSNTKIVIYNDALYDYYCFSSDSLNHKYRKDLKEIYTELIRGFSSRIQNWDLDEQQLAKFYSAKYHMLMRVMRNTYHPLNEQSDSERLRLNDEILRSKAFLEAVQRADCHINPLFRAAFATGSYRAVQLADHISAAKRRLFPKKQQ